jgi:recombination protein RecR
MEFASKLLENAVNEVSQLPGIGKRSALRMVLHLLKQPKENTLLLADALVQLTQNIVYCNSCHNISDKNICEICANPSRDQSIICVVEDIRDVLAIENTSVFKGLYHVLGGKISPMEGISPSQLKINSLIEKVQNGNVNEIIFALSSTIEGDTTIFYIHKQLKDFAIKFSTIARGIAVGDELEYADEVTLSRSLMHRIPFETAIKSL